MRTSSYPQVIASFDAEFRQLEQLIHRLAELGREHLLSAARLSVLGDPGVPQAALAQSKVIDEIEKQIKAACVRLATGQEEASPCLSLGSSAFVSKLPCGAQHAPPTPGRLQSERSNQTTGRIDAGAVQIDLEKVTVTRNGRFIHLGPTEYHLLCVLAGNPEHVFGRDKLLELVWQPQSAVEYRIVDVHIARLRRALNAPGEPNLIRTVRSRGYAYSEQDYLYPWPGSSVRR